MFLSYVRLAVLVAFLSGAIGCESNASLKPFSSDGCSLFPDRSPIAQKDWCECCFEHDKAYWRGGTREERRSADLRLKECVFLKTGDKALATLMYEGVRSGGSPYFYTWYRWGYGWSFDRKYQALNAQEVAMADQLLQARQQSAQVQACSK
jgi:hypothetical protein